MINASLMEIIATTLFVVAIIHTFSVTVFAKIAHKGGPHAGLWHYFAEVEAVFGIWAFVLLVVMAMYSGVTGMKEYVQARNFTEPLFVFVIMVIAASRPILNLIMVAVQNLARLLPMRPSQAMFFIAMSVIPLAGSLITEPAAMTLAAMILRDGFFSANMSNRFRYATLGVLFVNISIGGVLTSYAAPPVLMVASTFQWDTAFMFSHFGWRAVVAVTFNALVLTLLFKDQLANLGNQNKVSDSLPVPLWVTAVHVLCLASVVYFAHYPALFLGIFILFIGFTHAYARYQNPLMIKEGLMVGFFLAGLIILGGLQKWWLQDLLGQMPPFALYAGAMVLTAVTDNAALTYLGSLVEGTSDVWKYMLVAGAVTGGGLTVIANAPNPAGYSILKGTFEGQTISPLGLLVAASLPTLVAAVLFLLPPYL